MCSCGETAPHVVMTRTSFDGLSVCLWDDGGITAALGQQIRGLPMRHRRDHDLYLTAGRLLLGEACIRTVADLVDIWPSALAAAKADGLPGTMRRLHREALAAAEEARQPWNAPARWVALVDRGDGYGVEAAVPAGSFTGRTAYTAVCAWWHPFAGRFGLDRHHPLRRVVVARGYPGVKFYVGFADQDGVLSAGHRFETLAETRAYLRDLWLANVGRDNP